MIVKCSQDHLLHRNELINLDFVCSFRKADYGSPAIDFAFPNYVYGDMKQYWLYENTAQRDADFQELLTLVVHQLKNQ